MRERERWREVGRRHTRAMRVGLVASLLLHVLVALALWSAEPVPVSPFAAAGERRGSDRAAPGGGMRALELATPVEPVVVPPLEEPVAVPEAEEVPPMEEPLVEIPAISLADGLGRVGGTGPTLGPGLALSDGGGDGGTEEEGRFRVVPPRPRGLILPPSDRPPEVRGREVEIWVYVSAAGRVVPDSTRLLPPTGDRRFDRRLRDHASGWVFEAARRDGRAVGEWFRYVIVM